MAIELAPASPHLSDEWLSFHGILLGFYNLGNLSFGNVSVFLQDPCVREQYGGSKAGFLVMNQ